MDDYTFAVNTSRMFHNSFWKGVKRDELDHKQEQENSFLLHVVVKPGESPVWQFVSTSHFSQEYKDFEHITLRFPEHGVVKGLKNIVHIAAEINQCMCAKHCRFVCAVFDVPQLSPTIVKRTRVVTLWFDTCDSV